MDNEIWEKIKKAYETIKNEEMISRIDVIKGKISVYAIPSSQNPKNVIRIDVKD